MSRIICGVELNHISDLDNELNDAFDNGGFDYIVAPLVHSRFIREPESETRVDAFTRSDTLLPASKWTSTFVGKTSQWLELDSGDENVRSRSERIFKQEVTWAAHLSLSAVLLPPPVPPAINYAKCVAKALAGLNYMQIFVKIPVSAVQPFSSSDSSNIDTWEWWNQLRVLCQHHASLSPVLCLTADLPPPALLERWIGEPVKAIVVPTSIFQTNAKGYPVLTKAHQRFIARLSHLPNLQLILSGTAKGNNRSLLDYHEYMRHILSRARDTPQSQRVQFEAPYRDVLQCPLQPLQDNLESQTYETFERDPIKYQQYELAIEKALLDRDQNTTTVLMVVGAGRGPLVKAALRASKTTKRPLKVFAVEKNANAVVTLANLCRSDPDWRQFVTVVRADMRQWQAPELADILVSELLGSFGDNESSPECLDGAQKFLKPEGISIPASYTSFIAPVSSEKLHNEVVGLGKELKHFETPYVVKLHNFDELSAPQACFTFVHPTPQPADNSRYTALRFPTMKRSSLIHGFSGYFDATLYGDVHCSILPRTHSPGMFSWFPIFFPLPDPVYVREGESVELHMWRVVDGNRMYYEWALTSPVATKIYNVNGRSYHVGL